MNYIIISVYLFYSIYYYNKKTEKEGFVIFKIFFLNVYNTIFVCVFGVGCMYVCMRKEGTKKINKIITLKGSIYL